MHKKKSCIFFVIVFILLTAAITIFTLFSSEIISSAAEIQLRKLFPGSTVSIGNCVFRPARSVVFTGIDVQKGGIYRASVNRIKITYDLFSLAKGRFARVEVSGVKAEADFRRVHSIELTETSRGRSSGYFRVIEAEVSELDITVKTRDLVLQGRFSVIFSPETKNISFINSDINDLKFRNVFFESCRVEGDPSGRGAVLSIKKAGYGDIVITDISAALTAKGPVLSATDLSASVFNGDIRGNGEIAFDNNGDFYGRVYCEGLDLKALINDFKLEKKVDMTGKVKGDLSVKGSNYLITDIQGNFFTDVPGGVLVIKDTGFLEAMANKTGQPVNILVENFKYYKYNSGIMRIFLDGADLGFDIALEGDAGKRDFNVILHDMLAAGPGYGIPGVKSGESKM
ncbi:MAG: YdbH domain-containing protein [Candidatus Omnitrophota bacterium]